MSLFHELLIRSAQKYPNNVCLVHRKTAQTYGEVERQVRGLSGVLNEAGLQAGARVAIYLEKSIEETLSLLAVSMAGGIFVDINPLLKSRQIKHILNDSGALILITSFQRLKAIGPDLAETPRLATVIALGPFTSCEGLLPPNLRLISLPAALEQPLLSGDGFRRIDSDPAGIIYTSGSTGLPKGVVVSHRNLVAGADSVASYLRNNEKDRILSVLPFSFDYGLNQLTTALLVGATLVLQNYLGPADIVRGLEKEAITGLAGIPTLWSQLLQIEWTDANFPNLRYITNSGGRFPEQLVKEYRRRLPHTKIYLMYGLTEAFRSTYLEPDQVDVRPSSIGKAIPNAEIMVLNEEGQRCAPGEVGELVHRGVHVSLGYWNDAEKTRERFRPNPVGPAELQTKELVVFSGDLVKTDDEGYLYYLSRKDQMIKTAGFRVSPTEVEECFYNTGKVQDVVALGLPDSDLGEFIKVILSLRNGESLTADEILALASQEMPSYMIPKETEIRTLLPKNSNGKIDRAAIYRDELSARCQASQVPCPPLTGGPQGGA